MKSPFLIILSFLLVMAITAPSIITIAGLDTISGLAMDFGEEESQEKKEIGEKDILFCSDFECLVTLDARTFKIPSFCIEKNYPYQKNIFLPPPKAIG